MTLGSSFTEVDDIVGKGSIVQRVEIAGDICCWNLNSFSRVRGGWRSGFSWSSRKSVGPEEKGGVVTSEALALHKPMLAQSFDYRSRSLEAPQINYRGSSMSAADKNNSHVPHRQADHCYGTGDSNQNLLSSSRPNWSLAQPRIQTKGSQSNA